MKSSALTRKMPMARAGIQRKPAATGAGLLRVAAVQRQAKKRKCAVKTCRAEFVPAQSFITWCSLDCGHSVAVGKLAKQKAALARTAARAAKVDRADTKSKLLALKPRKWFLAKAKAALHAYIRARDEGRACISCDTILRNTGRSGGDYDAGHFRSVGSAKHLEFDERNIFGQCKHCNDHLKGNQLEYERRLRIREGDEFVDSIKADNDPRHLSIDDFKEIEAVYKARMRALEKTA